MVLSLRMYVEPAPCIAVQSTLYIGETLDFTLLEIAHRILGSATYAYGEVADAVVF